MTDAQREGREAFAANKSEISNPYDQHTETDKWLDWIDGFTDALVEAEGDVFISKGAGRDYT